MTLLLFLTALVPLVLILVIPSIRIIGPTEVGLVTKRFAIKKLPEDNPIAFQREAGYQADLLMPGWYFKLWLVYLVEKHPWVQVRAGEIGVVVAQAQVGVAIATQTAEARKKQADGEATYITETGLRQRGRGGSGGIGPRQRFRGPGPCVGPGTDSRHQRGHHASRAGREDHARNSGPWRRGNCRRRRRNFDEVPGRADRIVGRATRRGARCSRNNQEHVSEAHVAERSITTTPSPQELKATMKAFKKRLKLTRLDAQSSDAPSIYPFLTPEHSPPCRLSTPGLCSYVSSFDINTRRQ